MEVMHQHGLNRSLILHLREALPEARVDLKFDGYKMPAERPLVLIEPMQNNYEILAKQREAIGAIYRYQIGLFDKTSVNLSINQEKLTQIFNFDKFAFYDTLQSPSPVTGYFLCDLTGITPMPADDISLESNYHRVYFDVEIQTEKYKEAN